MTWDFIDNYQQPKLSEDQWKELAKEYGILIGYDLHRFIKAGLEKKQDILDEEFDKFLKVYARKLDPKNKLGDSIANLRERSCQ